MNSAARRGVDGLDGARFDALVIGGGILGAGVALTLAERGFTSLLVERADFGQGTTARSTRLIHGGLRYLAMFDVGVVREGLRERAWLLAELPNLVRPLPLVLPHYRQPLWQRARIALGLTLYDLLSPRGSLPRHRHLGAGDLARLEVNLRRDGLQSGEQYWDGQAELPERLVIEILRRATDHGAVVRNYVSAGALTRVEGRVATVTLTDVRKGGQAEVGIGTVINATGPWADVALRQLGVERPALLRLSQGVHLVYPPFVGHAFAVSHPRDGRLCFVIPWQGATLVGTTDTDVEGEPESARIRPEDVEYLREAVDQHFSGVPRPLWGTVGVRSLSRRYGRRGLPQSVSRRHVLVDHRADGVAGLYTLAGGKLTAWRATGRFVVDRISASLPATRQSAPGNAPSQADGDASDGADRLWHLYGDRAAEVRRRMSSDPYWSEAILPGSDAVRAEVAHAIEQEWAAGLADLVVRRLALGFGADLGRAAAVAVGEICRERLGWTDERVAAEIEAFDVQTEERRLPG
jgi:glycerol-3-phosphate dehydrogenase